MFRSRRFDDLAKKSFPRKDMSPATRTASDRQRKAALWISGLLILATVVLAPFAQTQWAKVPAFLPAYQTAVILAYLITAYLMYGHFTASRSEALLHLSAGCLYTAGVLIVQFLSFPGAFVEGVSLIGGAQTTIWLWFFWHAGPAIGILFFAWGEFRHPGRRVLDVRRSVRRTAIALGVTFGATAILVTLGQDLLPVLDVKGNFSRITTLGIAPALQVLLVVSLFLLWKASRFRNVLHVWLGITLVALLCDNAITMAGASRLSMGWYVGRINALISSSVMLAVYLHEITRSFQQSVATAAKLATSNEQLALIADAARLDALTKLPLRELFMQRSEALRAESVATHSSFATLFIDLDGFKSVNDRLGHGYGDWVLVRVADALRAAIREHDVVGRLGGDEFVVCLAGPKGFELSTVHRIAERIVGTIGQIDSGIGASIGISICSDNIETAVQQADAAMYAAKKLGKNRCSLFYPAPELVAAA